MCWIGMKKSEIKLQDCFDYPLIYHTGAITYFKQLQRELGITSNSFEPKIVTNSLSMIKKYLILSRNTLAISTLIGGVDEMRQGIIKFKEVEDEILKKNTVGLISIRNKVFSEYEEYFVESLIDSFKKELVLE